MPKLSRECGLAAASTWRHTGWIKSRCTNRGKEDLTKPHKERLQLRGKSCFLWIHDRLFALLQFYSLCKSNQGSARFIGFWGLRCSARSTYHTPVRRYDRSASPTDLQNIGSRRWIAPQHAFRLNLSTRQCGLGR